MSRGACRRDVSFRKRLARLLSSWPMRAEWPEAQLVETKKPVSFPHTWEAVPIKSLRGGIVYLHFWS